MPPKSKDKRKKQDRDPEGRSTTSQTEKDTKGAAGKSTAVDRSSSPQKDKDELWEECVQLTEELNEVQKEKKYLKVEIALKSSENSKRQRNLERTKARMREKLKLKQEQERCHQAETEEHQQKLVQLESAHHNEISELKIGALAMTSKTHMEDVVSEVEKKEKLLQMEKREKESLLDTSIRQHKMEYLHQLRELKQTCIRQLQELEAQYMQKIKDMVGMKMKEISEECNDIDVRMKAFAASVIKEHEDAWQSIKNVNCQMKDVPGEVNVPTKGSNTQGHLEALKKEVELHERMLTEQVQKGKRLEKSLLEMKLKSSESDSKLTVQRKTMAEALERTKKMTAPMLKEKRDLYLKNQELELQCIQAQQENEELQRKNAKALLDVQQKNYLKVLLLDRQIKSMTASLEKEPLKLWVALALRLGDQTAANNIEALFKSKHATIEALKDDISGGLMEYNKLVVKATALDPSVDNWLSVGVMEKSIRRVLEDSKKSVDQIQELMASCISEDKDFLGPNPVGAESRQ